MIRFIMYVGNSLKNHYNTIYTKEIYNDKENKNKQRNQLN